MRHSIIVFLSLSLLTLAYAACGQSVARQWNEVLLDAIRRDFARPTVHARNLFHTSAVMYDVWAIFNEEATPYLTGRRVGAYRCGFNGFEPQGTGADDLREALSYAAYRLLSHRFSNSPGHEESQRDFDSLMLHLGYDKDIVDEDYSLGSAAALGNYVASCMIDFGLQDGSNEENDYANLFYTPANPSLILEDPGNPRIIDPDRWQPLTFEVFIGQGGIEIPINTPPFLSPEWGNVVPFALTEQDLTVKERDGHAYTIYHDPGPPPLLGAALPEEYKWGFSLVSIWSAHMTVDDEVYWDISPASQGNINIQDYPADFEGHRDFYPLEGGDIGEGHAINPKTNLPYDPQMVKRGDYVRVLAEFWADGPDSETPPGHWFTILNKVNDHPELVKKLGGEGEVLSDLEWDIKTYFTLGGTMHDAAISGWSIKGYYDYVRPISAIRYMAAQGQSSDVDAPNYSENGIPLVPGYVELVESDDPLVGENQENLNQIKVYAWRGPNYIDDPVNDVAGVGWILAEDWWPFQRPTFVTPPFAGYVSGHSTFSSAAAEVLTALTGDPFFPGGVGEFEIKAGEFLVFEDGPSEDFTLQWATYRDASDQTSLSRIWGGIHPPADDIPGRLIGIEVGEDSHRLATRYFEGDVVTSMYEALDQSYITIYPNPASEILNVEFALESDLYPVVSIINSNGRIMDVSFKRKGRTFAEYDISALPQGLYLVNVAHNGYIQTNRIVVK